MAISLEEQARLESGLGVVFTSNDNHVAPNGNPNDAADPLVEGIDVGGRIWAVYSVRPDGGAVEYRTWVLWPNQTEWDCIEFSERTEDINRTQRPRISGAWRMYIEITSVASSVDVLMGYANGEYVAPSS